MQVESLPIDGLMLVKLVVNRDDRGFFVERFKRSEFTRHGLPAEFVQDNHSRSAPGVLRGLHYQYAPAQGKLVGVARGRIWDVAVDLRVDSPTFGRSFGVELSDMNGVLLWVPVGFAHGYCVIGDEPADVLYMTTAEYDPASESGIAWNDPDLAVEWPAGAPILSQRDMDLPSFAEYRANPPKWTE